MVNFKEFLEIMMKDDKVVHVYVGSKDIIYTGYIYEVGEDCLVMTFEKGVYDGVIPLDKIFMVSIRENLQKET